ncbi:AF4/FMR2 family member 4 isoform X3 [Rhinichthys klamathensis goyatoka]|uniref:AF4/FMR2 family member 4 isoform X3 n=1 Tax=Rhinichthys klamathensis goyatoka TaxID=3034132 RepID=UPI0024B5AE6C|nr:AF4/FMR2 family member 4 isoform X3 [Rhinichthys klamathensis goyatoka]
MSDRTPVCRSGQIKPSTSSVTMEDRDVLRRMERERRSQEVQQEETQYDRIAPLFSEPFKAESDEKFPNKKQKLDVEGKKFFSSQQSLHQKEASKSSETMMMMKKKRKKSTKHGSSVPPETRRDAGHKRRSDSQLRKAEAHGKKHCKSRSVFPEEPRPPTAEAHRQRSVEDHMKEAKKLKHKADATLDKMAKALCYLEAALAFVESAIAMETEPETPKSAYTMFSETLDLIRFILKLKNYTDPSATARERDFFILWSSVVSPVSSGSGSLVVPQHIQQAAASYVSITTLFLSAHETWEQADDLMTSGTGLLRELDSSVAPLSLTASMISLVTYIRLGLHRIRRATQNQNQP